MPILPAHIGAVHYDFAWNAFVEPGQVVELLNLEHAPYPSKWLISPPISDSAGWFVQPQEYPLVITGIALSSVDAVLTLHLGRESSSFSGPWYKDGAMFPERLEVRTRDLFRAKLSLLRGAKGQEVKVHVHAKMRTRL